MTSSKIPLHLQKALSGGSAEESLTDYKQTESTVSVQGGVVSSYRTPADRTSGNDTFRRYPDGTLDVEYAKHKVVDMLHRLKDGQPLTELEKCILTCCFPAATPFMDAGVADNLRAVNLRIAPEEMLAISMKVASHLAAEMNYNAGQGGGSVPGRDLTRA